LQIGVRLHLIERPQQRTGQRPTIHRKIDHRDDSTKLDQLLRSQFALNWLRVSIRLGAARLAERLGWEEMAAAKRAMR
jgi:hypothetical protein